MSTAQTTRRGRRTPAERAAAAKLRAETARANLEARYYAIKERQSKAMLAAIDRRGGRLPASGGVYTSSYATTVKTRLRNGATPMQGSADDHLDPRSRATLRLTAQDLLRTSPTARAGFERLSVCNTGPNGLSYQATTSDEEWNKAAEAWVENWWEYRFDCRGMMGRVEAQDTLLRSSWRDGDVLVVKLRNGSCQVVEGERIGSARAINPSDSFVEGVRLDAAGRPVAFEVARRVRGLRGLGGGADFTVVDARDCVFLVNPRLRWSSQTRGEPLLAALLQTFENITEVTHSAVLAVQMAAMLAMVIYTDNPAETQDAMTSQLTDAEDGSVAGATQAEQVWKPGSILHLKTGENVAPIEPKQPGPVFESFVRTMKRQIGSEMGLPLELLDMDFERTNFFGTRAAMVTAWLGFGRTQSWLGRRGLSPITLWALNNAIEDGELEPNPEWQKHKWVAAPMPAIDEEAMYKAKAVGVATGLITHKDAIEQLGGDQTEALDQMERERKDMQKRGIRNAVPSIVSGDPGQLEPGQAEKNPSASADGSTQNSGSAKP